MKSIVLSLLGISFFLSLRAQTYSPPSYAEIDTNFHTYVRNLFGQLEQNRVSTGLLMDYAFDFSEPKYYDGTNLADSTCVDADIFSDLYAMIHTSRFNTNAPALVHPSIFDSIWFSRRQREVITLSGMLFKYNSIKADAQSTGKMQLINGQLRDVYVNGVWQNPYEELRAFAVSPSIISYNLTYCNVVLPSAVWLGNMNGEVANIQFDAGDGQGYRTLSFDVPVPLNYSDTGWKHWVFRITLNNGQQLFSHTKIHFNNISNQAGSAGINMLGGTTDSKALITATESYLGKFGQADIIISYRDPNDKVLRRPLIIAEGLDPGHIIKPEEPEGNTSFQDIVTRILNSSSNSLNGLLIGPSGPGSVSQYDVIYVNWRNGTDYLQRNELVFEEVIRWVNQRKQPLAGIRQPNVVLGFSMGGLIARMALGRMDRSGGYNAHETRLYISMDAPHQGASIPLGYQAAFRHAMRAYIRYGTPTVAPALEVVQLIRRRASPLESLMLLDQPAPKQLLINRINFFYNLDNSTNVSFYNDIRTTWDYPLNIRCVAIANGSECGIDQEFAPGSSLLYHSRSTTTRFLGDIVFALAAPYVSLVTTNKVPVLAFLVNGTNRFQATLDVKALASGGGNQVYFGEVKYTKKVAWLVPVTIPLLNKTYTAPTGLMPFDSYPGSLYEVSINFPSKTSRDWMFTYNNTLQIQRRFAFTHTTSALDIGRGNVVLTNSQYTAKYIGASPPLPPYNSPFANFIAAYNSPPITIVGANNAYQFTSNGSEPHVGFYKRTCDWLANELSQVTPNSANCSFMCSNNNIAITGPSTLCGTSQVYTLSNAPVGTNIVWTASPAGIVSITPSPSGSQATVSKVSNGYFTLKATISNQNCSNLEVTSPSYRAGGYSSSNYPISPSFVSVCRNSNIFLSTADLTGATNYQWTWSSSLNLTYIGGQGTRYLTLKASATTTGTGVATVKVANACDAGGSPALATIQVNSCMAFFMASPNPSTGNVNLSTIQAQGFSANSSTTTRIYSVKIVDQYGVVKSQYEYPGGVTSANINISNLVSGIYAIQAFNGTEWNNRQIIKQ